MKHYIDKDILLPELEKKLADILVCRKNASTVLHLCKEILSFINTFEVKDVDTWHLQEKEDIYDAVKGWDIHTFACIMKDGTIQKFTGCRDEDYEGCITTYIDGVNDDYDDVDDIVKWIEV